jgi:hydrogenase nickel incorporation protein HypA/HybF
MHEVSIALGMVDELRRIAKENNASGILSVSLKIGKMSGIVIDSLKFAFDAIKCETPFIAKTKIKIDEVPLVYECMDCNKTFSPQDEIRFPSCPECKSFKMRLLSGEEMKIESLEIEV